MHGGAGWADPWQATQQQQILHGADSQQGEKSCLGPSPQGLQTSATFTGKSTIHPGTVQTLRELHGHFEVQSLPALVQERGHGPERVYGGREQVYCLCPSSSSTAWLRRRLRSWGWPGAVCCLERVEITWTLFMLTVPWWASLPAWALAIPVLTPHAVQTPPLKHLPSGRKIFEFHVFVYTYTLFLSDMNEPRNKIRYPSGCTWAISDK